MSLTEAEKNKDLGGFFAVHPKYDCPHLTDENFNRDISFYSEVTIKSPCADCSNVGENWVCLKCGQVKCSRYVQEHMLMHAIETSHGISLSFSDLSFWCYKCDSYISSPELKEILKAFQTKKFYSHSGAIQENVKEEEEEEEEDEEAKKEEAKEEKKQEESKEEKQQEETKNEVEKLEKGLEELKIAEVTKDFNRKTLEEFAEKLRAGVFKKIAIMAGAGISVNAGIPDFRSPGGFYSKVEKLGLPYPEAVFHIQYFREQPELFYSLSGDLIPENLKPTPTHYFLKLLEDKNQLMMCYTQNIDGLEKDAGLSPLKLLQAHGHFDSAHCIGCKKEYDINDLKTHIKESTVAYCDKCGKPAKPDVVFFGEPLPARFQSCAFMMEEADLLIVIGTSLVVFPFASLAEMVSKNVPRVVINKNLGDSEVWKGLKFKDPNDKRDVAFVGDCDEIIRELVNLCGWQEEFEALMKTN
ncbi:unnamed protein product [Blepharisma stoltei]|uniref:Protein acetyllysine N-acetyltransferase n=1 Tax=Blepharisma stoltei TaxID=1481888 RepID=A0AAU9ILH9_9CILI|nr:unnamed protein product [Blepharisma stoltei]